MTNEDYYNRGKNALLYFHNRALAFSDYKLTFNELIEVVENRGYKNFLRGLGMGIIDADIPEFNVRDGMQLLATKAKGRIPATNGAFTQAIASNVSDNISYIAAAKYVAAESSKEIGEKLVEIGEGVSFGLKYWYVFLPLSLGLGIYIYSRAQK